MNEDLLHEARRLADAVFRPNAQAADQGDIHGQVAANVRMLGQAGYFGLGISPDYGGMGADEATRREYTEVMASACGVTAFVQQQLHAGGGFVGGGRSEALKSEKLPRFASGEEFCGVAFSHLRRPGPPMVTAERADGQIAVQVADTGVGIAPEHLPHVTERFYRVEAARSRAGGGTGLGLSICRSIADLHGGRLEVTSVPEQGTTVRVFLQDAEPEAPASIAAATPALRK